VAVDRQVAQEVAYLLGSKLLRVSLAVEVGEATGPVDVGLLGTIRVVARPDRLAQPVEEAHAAIWRRALDGRADWTNPVADATIRDGRGGMRDCSHERIFRPHMQHVAHPMEGIGRGGLGRKALAIPALPRPHIRLHSSWPRVRSIDVRPQFRCIALCQHLSLRPL